MAAAGGAERLRGWRGVARRCGERARTAHGGGSAGARRRCGGTAAAQREGGGVVRIESGGGGVKGERKQRPAARARDIYDRWARDFP